MDQDSTVRPYPVKTYKIEVPYEVGLQIETIAEFLYISPANWIATVLEREVHFYDIGRMDIAKTTRTDFDKKWNKK